MSHPYKRIAVKIGSNVLTRKDGALDITRMSALVDQVAELRRAGIVEAVRGAGGGFRLARSTRELTLYDVIMAVEPDFSVIECIHHFCNQNSGSKHCKVHAELLRIQHTVEELLQKKTLYDILEG